MEYSIDGRFMTRGFGGQERYSFEVLAELDKLIEKNEIEVVVPSCTENIPAYKNIKVQKYGVNKGLLWEQIDFLLYIITNKKTPIYLCNTWSYFRPDFATIHDVRIFAMPEISTNLYGKLSVIYRRALYRSAVKRANIIFTVSEFSKREIVKYLNVDEKRIVVLESGWQHYERIIADYSIFEKLHDIKCEKYYLAVSSRTPQKNFKWIVESAKSNPDEKYLIVGKKVGSTVDNEKDSPQNVIYLGELTDGEIKALMENAKALIHPAIYEGFGLTPLEALASGSPIIISRAACLPEIYGDSAHYIDPVNSDVDLDALLLEKVSDPSKVLEKYSWKNNAIKLLDTLRMYSKE